MHPNKVVVTLAAKMARVAWVILNRLGALYERRADLIMAWPQRRLTRERPDTLTQLLS